MKDLQIEREKLSETVKTIHEVLATEREEYEELYDEIVGKKEELWPMLERKRTHIMNLETSIDHPYFARVDFNSYDDGKTNEIYIGKNGVMKDADIIITDWRAPISSLYYDAEVGKCSYETPTGIIDGEMKLKRQFEIEKGKLIEYFDVDIVSNDGLLQKYLNSNNDSRLKSIVSTIQKEQNDVIRKKLSDNIIVQGVAGSGKTTVALHRIAYLVYNYINSIKENQYLVIGPNPVFLKYIKSVLPELDVSGASQFTFEQFAKQYINEDININRSDKKANDNIEGKIENDIDGFKSSMKYKDMIDEFLKTYYESITKDDLKLGDFVVLKNNIIKETFNFTNISNNITLNDRIEMTINRLSNYIENNHDRITLRYAEYTFEKLNEASEDEKSKLRNKFAKEREEITKNYRNLLRKYFIKAKLSPTKLYKEFINNINNYDTYNYKDINELKTITLNNIKKGNYDFEDLSALMYIKKCTSPEKEYEKYKHVVVDEAQDLGEFNFFILKKTLSNATFSIFGDLAQSIYDYRGVDNWQKVNESMFNESGTIINFNKSYRTTAEIMNVADEVASSIGLWKSDLVIRHGNPVNLTKSKSKEETADLIIKRIEEYKNKGYNSIAVISKTDKLSIEINELLKERNVNIPNVSIDDDLSDEKFRICTISNQLSKGLEFDAVIINNASEEIYSSENKLDMKLLYVAITRALHELDIIYNDEITKTLLKYKK